MPHRNQSKCVRAFRPEVSLHNYSMGICYVCHMNLDEIDEKKRVLLNIIYNR